MEETMVAVHEHAHSVVGSMQTQEELARYVLHRDMAEGPHTRDHWVQPDIESGWIWGSGRTFGDMCA